MSLDLAVKGSTKSSSFSPQVTGLSILFLVFLCGAVAGAVAMNFGHSKLHPSPFWKDSARTEYLNTISKELDLTPEQRDQMDSILKDFAQYYQTVLSDGKARILNILNEDQKRKFYKMLKERPH